MGAGTFRKVVRLGLKNEAPAPLQTHGGILSQTASQKSLTKTVTSVFHLHNANAARMLTVQMNGQRLQHDPNPVHLGITLDRTLDYKQHLTKTAEKLKRRNNLLSKLAGSSWEQMRTLCGRPHWLYAILWRNIVQWFGFTQPTQITQPKSDKHVKSRVKLAGSRPWRPVHNNTQFKFYASRHWQPMKFAQ